jgi:hypothetical protein
MPQKSVKYSKITILLFILAFAAYLRLYNITENPGWYTDEGTNLDVAQLLRITRSQQFVSIVYFRVYVSILINAHRILSCLERYPDISGPRAATASFRKRYSV